MAAAAPAMDIIVARYRNDGAAQLLDLLAQGQRELEKHKVGAYAVVHSLKTLTHPKNRGTAMLDISAVPQKVADISDVAFAENEVLQACAVRMPPAGSKERLSIEIANELLVGRSGATLAPVERENAEIMVCGCTHNTAGLKAINAQAKCTIPRISEHGCYSAAKIIGRCPSYKQPLENGLRYFVVEYEVERRWPDFIELTIEACNIGSALSKQDNVLMVASKIHARVLQAEAAGEKADYKDIQAKILRTKPALGHALPQIADYVEHWCGGVKNPRFLIQVQEFAQTLERPLYDQLVAILEGITKINMGVGKGGRYRCGMMKLVLAKENPFRSSYLSALNLPKGSALAPALKAEELMMQFEQSIAKLTSSSHDFAAAVGAADIDVLSFVHKFSRQFETMNAIFVHHFDLVVKNRTKKPTNPFKGAEVVAAPTKAKAFHSVQELGPLGLSGLALLDIMHKAMHMEVGTEIELINKGNAPSSSFLIVSMDDGGVCLTPKGDKRRKILVGLQVVVDGYKVSKQGPWVTCKR